MAFVRLGAGEVSLLMVFACLPTSLLTPCKTGDRLLDIIQTYRVYNILYFMQNKKSHFCKLSSDPSQIQYIEMDI